MVSSFSTNLNICSPAVCIAFQLYEVFKRLSSAFSARILRQYDFLLAGSRIVHPLSYVEPRQLSICSATKPRSPELHCDSASRFIHLFSGLVCVPHMPMMILSSEAACWRRLRLGALRHLNLGNSCVPLQSTPYLARLMTPATVRRIPRFPTGAACGCYSGGDLKVLVMFALSDLAVGVQQCCYGTCTYAVIAIYKLFRFSWRRP